MSPIRVLLVDDHDLVRQAVRYFLETDETFEIVGEASSADDALELIGELRPDVALLDIALGEDDGIEVCREIRRRYPEVRCLMLTGSSGPEGLVDSVLAGALGFVTKGEGLPQLGDAIRTVASGTSLFDRRSVKEIAQRLTNPQEVDPSTDLNPQDERILELLGQGLTNHEIAERVNLTEQTIKSYVSDLLSKLGIERRTQAVVYATRLRQLRRETRPVPPPAEDRAAKPAHRGLR